MTRLADAKEDTLPQLSSLMGFDTAVAAHAPSWLESLRKAGSDRFSLVGFPNTRQEEWRFTNTAPIARTVFKLADADGARADGPAAETAARFSFGPDAASELVFVNGRLSLGLSKLRGLPRGVQVGSLADAIAADHPVVRSHLSQYADIDANPFVALNSGLVSDGAFVHFARGCVVEQPIHLLFVQTPILEPTISHPRLLIVLEDGATGTFVESYTGSSVTGAKNVYFTNAVTEIIVGKDAHVDHCKLQQEGPDGFHIATMQVHLSRSAHFVSHSASIGGKLTRNDLNVTMAGEGADATLNGLSLIGNGQHVDNHTMLDHATPNCASHELYKHVLDGRATGVFKGKILVRQPAQKTDSKQTSKSLLLSDDAVMHSQPALEIYADDVKCTHGSTVGPVDEEQVFYMRSRGVGLRAARHLMTYAFAADVTRRIKVEPVRRRLEEYMAAQHGLPQDLRITDLGSHDEAAMNL